MAATVWKGQLTFGLVSFAIRLVKAARKNRTPLRYVRTAADPQATAVIPSNSDDGDSRRAEERDNSLAAECLVELTETTVAPVRRAFVSTGEGESIPSSELHRGYEVTPGRFAVVRAEELKPLRHPTSSEMQIIRSVRMEEIDPVFLETSYYVHPGSGGEHSYRLFYRALRESGYSALAEVAMHGRQHVVVIRAGNSGLIAHTMYYVDEVRGEEEHATATGDVPAKELELAKRFVEAIAAPFQPEEFRDQYRRQLESLIASKTVVVSESGEVPDRHAAQVINIMEALRKSLEKAEADKSKSRKPVAKVTEPRNRRKRRA